MNTTENLQKLLTESRETAATARKEELAAADALDAAARAYTKAVKDWEPRETIYRLDQEMMAAARDLTRATRDRHYADQVIEDIQKAIDATKNS